MRSWMTVILVLTLVPLLGGCSKSEDEKKAAKEVTWGPLLEQRASLRPQLTAATQAWRELRGPMELANAEWMIAKKGDDEARKAAAKEEYDRLVGAYTAAANKRQELDTLIGDVEFKLKKLGWTPPPAASTVPDTPPVGGN